MYFLRFALRQRQQGFPDFHLAFLLTVLCRLEENVGIGGDPQPQRPWSYAADIDSTLHLPSA